MPYKVEGRKKSWRGQVRYRNSQGKQRKTTKSFITKKDAILWEIEEESKVARYTTLTESLGSWAVKYLDHSAANHSKKTYSGKVLAFKLLFQFPTISKNDHPEQLTKASCLEFLTHCHKTRGGSPANNYLKDLKAAWEWGIDYNKMPEANPFRRIPKFAADKKPRYVPPVDDFWAVYDVAGRQDQILLQAYLHTAARRGELFRLTWDDVNFSARAVTLTAKKNQVGEWRTRDVGMSDAIYDDLREQHERTGDSKFVFLSEHFNQPWVTREKIMPELCEKAGVKSFGFHGIRHLSASLMYHYKIDMKEIQKVLGHESLTTTEIYIKSLVSDNKAMANLPSRQKKSLHRRPTKSDGATFLKIVKPRKEKQ